MIRILRTLFRKEQNTKEVVVQWILAIEKEKSMPDDIIALNFGIYEPYSMDLIGAKHYDAEDDDWACDEDYVPKHRVCPALGISDNKKWDTVLGEMTALLKEVINEFPNLRLWKVEHITVGFSDGNLVKIK